MKLTIGNVQLDNNLIMAPMAGVTDLPFRMLCKEQGCGLLYTEMVSAKRFSIKIGILPNCWRFGRRNGPLPSSCLVQTRRL